MVNETAPDGFSALHIAAANDNAEIASILLDQVNMKNAKRSYGRINQQNLNEKKREINLSNCVIFKI